MGAFGYRISPDILQVHVHLTNAFPGGIGNLPPLIIPAFLRDTDIIGIPAKPWKAWDSLKPKEKPDRDASAPSQEQVETSDDGSLDSSINTRENSQEHHPKSYERQPATACLLF